MHDSTWLCRRRLRSEYLVHTAHHALREAEVARPSGYSLNSSHRLRRRGPRSFAANLRRQAAFGPHAHDCDEASPAVQESSFAIRQVDTVRFQVGSSNAKIRRRGPRSSEAILRRQRGHATLEQDGGLCESSVSPYCSDSSFSMVHVNIRGFLSHRHELEVYLETLGFPNFVGLTETFLDKSVINPTMHGYVLISRLDRQNGRSHGGIAFFARSNMASFVVHAGDSKTDERSWLFIHSNLDLFWLVCGTDRPLLLRRFPLTVWRRN